jgi:hypothetical protein
VFFVRRTSEDSRVGKGEKLDHNTLRLIITIRTSTKGFSISSPPKRSRTMSRCFRVWPFEKPETIFGRPHRRKFRLADHGGEVMKRAREVVGGTELVPERGRMGARNNRRCFQNRGWQAGIHEAPGWGERITTSQVQADGRNP